MGVEGGEGKEVGDRRRGRERAGERSASLALGKIDAPTRSWGDRVQ